MATRSLRLPDDLNGQVTQTARARGYTSTTAFIRTAIKDAITKSENENAMEAMEGRLVRQLQKLNNVQHAQIALVDALVKIVLTSTPEPDRHSIDLAKQRYEKFLKSAAEGLRGNLLKALQETE